MREGKKEARLEQTFYHYLRKTTCRIVLLDINYLYMEQLVMDQHLLGCCIQALSGGRGTGELGLRSHQLLYSTSMTMMTASITQIQCYCGTSFITINVSNFHF